MEAPTGSVTSSSVTLTRRMIVGSKDKALLADGQGACVIPVDVADCVHEKGHPIQSHCITCFSHIVIRHFDSENGLRQQGH